MLKDKSNWYETCNVEVKIECAIWNERINGLTINHSLALLAKQKQTHALDVEEMESFKKVNLKDVSWWIPSKLRLDSWVSIIAKFSKERCIFLTTEGRLSWVTWLSLCLCICHNMINTYRRRHTLMFVMTWETHLRHVSIGLT